MISNTTSSGGGSIIALPAEIAHLWRGTLPPVEMKVPEDWQWGGDDGIICDFDSAFEGYKNPEDIYADNDVVVAQLSPGTYKIFHYNNEDEVGFVRLEIM